MSRKSPWFKGDHIFTIPKKKVKQNLSGLKNVEHVYFGMIPYIVNACPAWNPLQKKLPHDKSQNGQTCVPSFCVMTHHHPRVNSENIC